MSGRTAFDGVLLDIDGTLWDSREQVAESWRGVIEEACPGAAQKPFSFFTGLFGLTSDEIADAMFPDFPPDERRRWTERCLTVEVEYLAEHPGVPYPGVREACEAIARKGLPILVASNCQAGYPELAVKACGIESFVAETLCYGQTRVPKSETIRILVHRHNLRAPVYVGDTEKDEEACREAGVPFIHAAYGFGSANNPFATIRSLSDLLPLL